MKKDKENTQCEEPKKKEDALVSELTSDLNRGKVKRLSLWESVYAKSCGMRDGKDGIPRFTDEGEWKSPFLEKEYNSYQEYCSCIWGKLQLKLTDAHIACDSLVDDLYRLSQKMNNSKKESQNEVSDSESHTMRKAGEEDLTDDQVLMRRNREQRQRAAKKRAAISAIEAEFVSKYKELSYQHSVILESSNAARLICERVMNHSRQLAEVYWRSAYHYHPERNKMPISVRPFGISDAERIYMEEHTEHDSAVIEILKRYEKKVMELETNMDNHKEVA